MTIVAGRLTECFLIVDAMPAYSTDEVFLLEQAHVPFIQFSPRAAGIDFYGDVLFTSDRELKEHPDRVRRFVEASVRGWYYALAHREELARLIYAQYSKRHSLEHLLFEAEQTRFLVAPDLVEIGHMSPARWRYIADTYAELGMMPRNFPLDGFLVDARSAPPDYTRYYLMLGAMVLAAALAVWFSLHFSRLNRALRREVSERRRLQEDLERLANTDALTGLPNRRFFMMHLASNFTSNLFFPYSDRVEVLRMLVVLVLGSLLCISMSRKAGQVFAVRRKVSAVPE